MHKVGLVVLLAGFVLGYGNPVLAREGGGGHHDGVGRDGNEKRGGAAFDHRSQKASENSNAQWSSGATKGQDRADLRRQDSHERGHGKDRNGQARGHSKEHGGKARGHGKDHGGKARGHDKHQSGQGGQNRDSN